MAESGDLVSPLSTTRLSRMCRGHNTMHHAHPPLVLNSLLRRISHPDLQQLYTNGADGSIAAGQYVNILLAATVPLRTEGLTVACDTSDSRFCGGKLQ